MAGSVSRRAFLGGTVAGAGATGLAGWAVSHWGVPGRSIAHGQSEIGALTKNEFLPGKYPGRVVEINDPAAVIPKKFSPWGHQERNPEVVKAMIARGMKELVGSDDSVEAWKHFFSPGDRVGIKVNPVGAPDAISSHEVVRAIVDGLKSAGVSLGDMMIFDRYKVEFRNCKYHELADQLGVHWEVASAEYDEKQLRLDGQLAGKDWEDKVSGYDPDVFRELPFCEPANEGDPLRFKSHLCNIVSKKLDKFIAIPVLKDHRSSGITFCLKNLSHGLVNNVCRSHLFFGGDSNLGKSSNQCGTFIPSMVSLPPTRRKAVLQIGDSLVATYEGGPGNWNRTWRTWNNGSLFFGTDPVAMDRIGWEILDAKRAAEGWPGVGSMGTAASAGQKPGRVTESFHIRQPEHVPLAGTLGLGVFDRTRIEHVRYNIG